MYEIQNEKQRSLKVLKEKVLDTLLQVIGTCTKYIEKFDRFTEFIDRTQAFFIMSWKRQRNIY